ncbi:unnamed protein product [Diatraea saccharalis]|uniref:Major facilitator superfamily (MFS) profile domain-containing protein n=1 Tax=Diatraea saccharalis TaxID=40085 RepID=A0A9N9R136_9NEOP|nr:unnamed protein product [Diatraea saccharalis]
MTKVEKVSFEEALSSTGFGKFNVCTFLLCSTVIMGTATEILSVAYLVPASACELLTTNTQQGLMAAFPLLGIVVTSHFWGYQADTRGRKKVMLAAMIASSITSILSSFSPDWITFTVFKFLSSGCVAGALAIVLTLLSECTPAAKRALFIMFSSSVFLSSNSIIAIIAIPVLQLKFSYYIPFLNIQFCSWRALCLIISSSCVLGLIGVCFLYESPKYLISVGEEEKALKIMQNIFVINKNKSKEEYPVKSMFLDESTGAHVSKGFFSSILDQTIPLFKHPLLNKTILLSVLLIMLLMSIQPYLVWFPYMIDGFMKSVQTGEENLTFCQRLRASQNATETMEVSDCSINKFALTIVFGVGILLSVINIILSTLVKYIGRKRLIIIIQFVAGLGAVCLNFSTQWILSGFLIIVFIAGMINFGMITSVSVDLFPTHVKAMAVSFTLMVGRASVVVGINVLKQLLHVNCEASFYMFGAITLLCGVVCFLLPRDAKPPSNKCTET